MASLVRAIIAPGRAGVGRAIYFSPAMIEAAQIPTERDYLDQLGASMISLKLCDDAMRLILRVLGGNGLREGPSFERRYRVFRRCRCISMRIRTALANKSGVTHWDCRLTIRFDLCAGADKYNRTEPKGADAIVLTGEQYKKSLNDGRATFFEGHRVEDLVAHPVLGQSVDQVAEGYDRWRQPGEDARNPLISVPRSAEELRARIPMQHGADILALVTYQSLMTLTTAAARISAALPEFARRIRAYVEKAQASDIRIVECITDAKGDRSLPPAQQDDPDAYTHVVSRTDKGVVIRGAKLHITAASLAHELMVIPTKAMHKGEESYAIACVVPVNAPGVKIINTSYAPRQEDVRSFPFSSRIHMPEGS